MINSKQGLPPSTARAEAGIDWAEAATSKFRRLNDEDVEGTQKCLHLRFTEVNRKQMSLKCLTFSEMSVETDGSALMSGIPQHSHREAADSV